MNNDASMRHRLILEGLLALAAGVYFGDVWVRSYRGRSVFQRPPFGRGRRWHRDTNPWNYWLGMATLALATVFLTSCGALLTIAGVLGL
ncbi:MAG TPA: hypothetical protein VG538_05725 [Vicinamibacterales bacterium]|jgi:hypothetical protein|nr:hypothetical protein [Vicinamibacterales bacterium]